MDQLPKDIELLVHLKPFLFKSDVDLAVAIGKLPLQRLRQQMLDLNLNSFRVGNLRYRLIRCGKKGCTKCPHGPYLYKRFKSSGKSVEKYQF